MSMKIKKSAYTVAVLLLAIGLVLFAARKLVAPVEKITPIIPRGNGMPSIAKEEVNKCNSLKIVTNTVVGRWFSGSSEGGVVYYNFGEDHHFTQVQSDEVFVEGNWALSNEKLILTVQQAQQNQLWSQMAEYYQNNKKGGFEILKNGSQFIVKTNISRTTESGYSNVCALHFNIGSSIYYKK